MLTLVQGGEILAPEPRGQTSILLTDRRIARLGEVDPRGAEALGLPLETIDAAGCWVVPGLIDPHSHLDLSRRGSFVDMDAAQENLAEKVREFLEQGGREDRLTLSSDADSNKPSNLFLRWRQCVLDEKIPLERALPLVTRNAAEALHLARKGRLEEGADADLVVLRKGSLEIVHVIAKGRVMVRDGEILVREKFLETSERKIELEGRGEGE